jgi:hypothetical protein
MYRISIIAVIAGFGTELIADEIIRFILIILFAQGAIEPNMSEEAATQALKGIAEQPGFLAAVMILGTATTVGGGYLAARIARRFPYYNGLAIGIVGLTLQLYLWKLNPLWMNIIALLTVIPMSIWGAHLAKPHLPPPE